MQAYCNVKNAAPKGRHLGLRNFKQSNASRYIGHHRFLTRKAYLSLFSQAWFAMPQAGLAGRLTGSLAFAAAAVLGTLAKIAGLNGIDVLHIANPPNFMSLTVIIARPQRTVNELTEENSPKRKIRFFSQGFPYVGTGASCGGVCRSFGGISS